MAAGAHSRPCPNLGKFAAMQAKWIFFSIGLALFLLGGALLAFSGQTLGTGVGIAGLILMIWAWWNKKA